jgi:predicted nuclease of restriction endonuclease-like (RecB) superfamily
MSFFSNYIYIIDEFEEELIMNYYEEIKDLIEKKEVKDGVRRLSYNSDKLKTYYEIGKLLVEAQGGEERAKYGNSLIKKWSLKLVEQYGSGYNISNLKRMRQFYTIIQKGAPLEHQLNISWTNWKYLLPIKNENERNYYINQCILNNLSKRELAKLIKEKAYDRLSYADKNNIKIINSKNEASYSLKDMLLDPIIIKSPGNENISEKVLKKYILDELRDFFLQLGSGFLYAGSEYKLDYYGKHFYVDILLFNINLNCYIPVELKLNSTNYKDVSQVQLYRKIIDNTIKKKYHNKSIGLIISKKNDNFIFEYVNDEGVYLISYDLEKVI